MGSNHEKFIDRPIYLKKLLNHKDVDLVKIITGIRRSCKSLLLGIFHNYLVKVGILEKNIIHINLESLKHRDLNTIYRYMTTSVKGLNKVQKLI